MRTGPASAEELAFIQRLQRWHIESSPEDAVLLLRQYVQTQAAEETREEIATLRKGIAAAILTLETAACGIRVSVEDARRNS